MFDQLRQAHALKKTMSKIEVTGEAVQGMVKVTIDGGKEIKKIEIDPQLLTPENKEQVENALQEAFKECDKQLQKEMISKVQSGEISLKDITG